MDSLISIAGSVTSIGGAIWAFVEARNAASSATKAKSVRDELIDRRKLVEVSKVFAQTERLLMVVSKIGPSCNPKTLKGVDCTAIAQEVEEYSRFLNTQGAHFSEHFENKAKILCDDLKNDIEELSEVTISETKKDIGKRIYYKINEFMPFVKELTDEKQEHSVVNGKGKIR
ncbi:hypothetical protein [Aeromonas hydrophila]|uniref:hypothetical protein n=1 Tax=Aeromonas hydrophila TaxID=644 RepID=UPI00145531DE|nr:hypothetical protein [Aeromonas hydrophila]NLR33966.1 hypothetical protein [Aeromonas hydrophila]